MFQYPDGKIASARPFLGLDGNRHPVQVLTRWPVADLNLVGVRPFREEGFDAAHYQSLGHTDEERTLPGGGVEVVRVHQLAPALTVEELRERRVAEVKAEAGRRIEASGHDWQASRFAADLSRGLPVEQCKPIRPETLAYAQALRDATDAAESELSGLADYADLAAWRMVWPAA